MNKQRFIVVILLLLSSISLNVLFSKDNHNHTRKCGLNLVLNPESREKLQRALKYKDGQLDVGQKYFISKNNLFKIHYDTIGVHAPQITDNDKNGVPDYIDSVAYYFEYAYKVQVEEIGYKSPIPDRGGRGSDHYDVYIWDLGNSDNPNDVPYHEGGTYGLTIPTEDDIISYEPFQRTYSFIVVDNDYSPNDSVRIENNGPKFRAYKETGIDALKITASHEFQHAIQFLYGIPEPAAITMMEMCGVAMEIRLFPESKDYIQYVKNIFSNLSAYPFGIDNQHAGYGFSIFAKYILQNYGDNILKNMWELVGKNIEIYRALDSSFKLNNLNFIDEFEKFTKWIYYTGDRAIDNLYFDNAIELPEIRFDRTLVYSPPSISSSRGLLPLEVGAVRYFVKGSGNKGDDTLDILYTNIDRQSASSQFSISRDYNYILTEFEGDGRKLLEKLNLYYGDNSDNRYIRTQIIEKPGVNTIAIEYAFPNPYNPIVDEKIYFPTPETAEIYDYATLTIYNTEMLPLITHKDKIGVSNNKRVIALDKLDLQSGVYIYGVHTKDNYVIGKFTIIRK